MKNSLFLQFSFLVGMCIFFTQYSFGLERSALATKGGKGKRVTIKLPLKQNIKARLKSEGFRTMSQNEEQRNLAGQNKKDTIRETKAFQENVKNGTEPDYKKFKFDSSDGSSRNNTLMNSGGYKLDQRGQHVGAPRIRNR